MRRITTGFEYLAAAMLILLTLLIFVQVVLRNFLGCGFVWSEEMARYLLLSMVLIMSPVLFYYEEHVGIDFISRKLQGGKLKLYKTVLYTAFLFFYAVYIVSHLKFVEKMGNVRTPSLNMPNFWYFLAGLIGAVSGVCVGIFKLFKLFYSGEKS